VHTFHGHIFRGYFSRLQTNIFILIERFLAIFTTKIVTVSESVKDDLINLRICRTNKILIVPLGFELEKFMSIKQRDDNTLNIGIVGRLVPVKNHRLFLDAAAKFMQNNRNINVRFKIIGDGELRKNLKEYTHKLKIDSCIDFLSWQKDLVRVYSDLDTVVLTSINEGTPVSLIEAMAAGKAVVATNVGGVPDLLGREIEKGVRPNMNFRILERGIMVNPDDAFSLAAALGLLSQNKQLRNDMGERARNFVKGNFTKERLIKDIENLYDNLISCHTPP
jgi:glycosyltransferase involved in cell wall biosynthesis